MVQPPSISTRVGCFGHFTHSIYDLISKELNLPQLEGSSELDKETSVWIKLAINGDLAAFEKLYLKYHRRVYLYAKRMSGSIQEAEEVVQDTFVKTWQKLDSFRADSQFYSWLRTIASRILIDRLRSKNAKIWQDSLEFEDVHLDKAEHAGKLFDLEKLITKLPEGARSVFVMHEIEGYTHAEISKLSGIAVGSSKAQLSRARKLLRESL